MNLIDLFDLTLRGRAAETALEFEGRELTFGRLEADSNRLARFLAEEGVAQGDRVAVYLPNSVELILVYLASLKLGALFTPINERYRANEIGHILSDAEPARLLTTEALAGHLPPDAARFAWEEIAGRVAAQSPERPRCPARGDSPAALVYTSGTTGRPKGAVLTHNNLAANALVLNTCWLLRPEDRALHVLPLAHLNGLANGLHPWLTTGFRMRLLDRFRRDRVLDEFLDFRPTFFFGVPAIYERLLEAAPQTAAEIGRRMRLFVSGSAPLTAEEFERFRERYGHAILERYGMTETQGNLSSPYVGERRPGSVGKPLPGVSLRLSEGDRGEIQVKGPTVFAGYWRNAEATRAAFTDDGYFRTGDLAERSPDGYYTLKGRRDDLILSGGYNIYPAEIETILKEQPGVQDAVVVGKADAVLGQVPVAFILPRKDEGFDEAALRQACRDAMADTMAGYKTPREFHCVDQFPRNALGKIERRLLADRL